MSSEYESFLICFHPQHIDVYRNGLPLGIIKDGVFHPMMDKNEKAGQMATRIIDWCELRGRIKDVLNAIDTDLAKCTIQTCHQESRISAKDGSFT